MDNKIFFLLCSSIFLIACNNKIESGETLAKTDKDYIQSLNLLDKDEKIYKFYSEYKNKIAGNFFTNKRLAKYWIDNQNKSKNEISFAYYLDIKSIDTIYNAGATYCPYLLVTKKDGSKFKVCVEGTRNDIKTFFEEALNTWKRNKQ